MSRALAKKEEVAVWRRQQIEADTLKVKFLAARHMRKMAEPGEDGDRLYRQMTNRDRVAMIVFTAEEARRREEQITERALGVIVVRDRLSAEAWEKEAQRVEEDRPAIDVEVVK